jgi:hypothetical protein
MNATISDNVSFSRSMSLSPQLQVAPFRVLADFREAVGGWQFNDLDDAAQPGRKWKVPVEYRWLESADYTVEGLPLFIVRKNAKEFAAALRHWPESVVQEQERLCELEASGAACLVVIEGSQDEIEQVLESGVDAFVSSEGGIGWLFAPSRRAAELMVFAVMQRAWLRAEENRPHDSAPTEEGGG